MENFSKRTDLAIEVAEMLTKEQDKEIKGVKLYIDEEENIKTSWVLIEDEQGEEAMGKPIGNYITIESEAIKENDVLTHERITDIFSKSLVKICNLEKNSTVLIVGLGNWNVTPDALGPKVADKVLVTRHIKDILPDEIKDGVRVVSAISPGVMGLTGIETAEIVKGVVDKIKPDIVIAIDALATRKTSRINATIQISDTGIAPGGGMGNKRKTLDKDTLGVPVIAIGVPTVVDAGTLVNDTIDIIIDTLIEQINEGKEFYNMIRNIDKEEKYDIITSMLNSSSNLFVTPKEIDATIERLAKIISNSLNIALHPTIEFEDINRYIS